MLVDMIVMILIVFFCALAVAGIALATPHPKCKRVGKSRKFIAQEDNRVG